MNNSNKIVIDENIQNTFSALNADPNNLRVKNYARNLPSDYADDFIYALFEASLTYNAKKTLTKLVLRDCRDESAGTNIENERFNRLYNAAVEANPECKNGYLPILFSYIQMIADEEGLTEDENKTLISKFLNTFENDKTGTYPDKLYQQDEYDSSIGKETPCPAKSFLTTLKNFYANLLTNSASAKLFDRQKIDTILNQYIDDIYSLTYEDNKKSISFFERSDDILTIEKCDKNNGKGVVLDDSSKDHKKLYERILNGLVSISIYSNGKYDFSYFSSAANLLSQNIDSFLGVFNSESKEKLDLPTLNLPEQEQEEFNNACKNFVAAYMTALISQKYNLENENNDPEKLLDPNLKINLMKSDEEIFNIATNNGMKEEKISQIVRNLIGISKKLVNFLENENVSKTETQKEVEKNKTQNNVEVIEMQNVENNISSAEILKYTFKYLKRQEKVYLDVIRKLEKIKGNRENNRNYTKDENMFMEFAALYAPEKNPKILTIDELVDIVDKKADKFAIAINAINSRPVFSKLSACVELYNTPAVPEPVKRQEVKYMETLIRDTLAKNRCFDKEIVDSFVKIFKESLDNIPLIRSEMTSNLLEKNIQQLKSTQVYKKALAFSTVIGPTLYLDKENNKTIYSFVESIMPKKSLRLEQKYIACNYAKDAIRDMALLLKSTQPPQTQNIERLEKLADRFNENRSDSIIKNGVMSKETKTKVVGELKNIYSNLPRAVKQDKQFAKLVNLVDLIPSLIKKIPTSKMAAAENLVNFICEFAGKGQKQELLEELNKDLKLLVTDDSNNAKIKEKYFSMLPADQRDVFEQLWANLPRVGASTKDKNIFDRDFKKILMTLSKDERTKYLTYYKQLFAKKARTFKAENQEEKEQIENYLKFAKEELKTLILKQTNNSNLNIDVNELLRLLDTYANVKVDIKKTEDENDDEEKSK